MIGGLVDDSVKKDTSRVFSDQSGLRTARLPIAENMARGTGTFKQVSDIPIIIISGDILIIIFAFKHIFTDNIVMIIAFNQVLTVNQVFDTLLKFHETADWAVALAANVPLKTGFVLKEAIVTDNPQGK